MTIYQSPEPMALATGSPRKLSLVNKSRAHRRALPGASAHGSGGFTLIEAMIAITMTLIIMLALAQGFKRLSDDISQGRARLALSDQLRSISEVLRNDLASLTVDPDPTSPNNKLGYFMYYDGPVTDYTAATLPINTTVAAGATTEQRLSASKYGDFDDVLMFTAKANGDLFKGRVPLAVVKGAAAFQAGTSYTPTQSDWVNSVVLASEFAEIAYFMVPMNVVESGGDAEFAIPTIDASGSLDFEDRDVAVNPTATFTVPSGRDLLPNGVGNGVPDRMILCRRVLLIIPSLNVPLTPNERALTYTNSSPSTIQELRMLAPQTGTFAMGFAYQGADLSIRRARSASVETPGLVPVTANSLEDLANPANRFAHTMLPIGGTTTTMPILALTPVIPIQEHALKGTVLSTPPPPSGFVSPSFLRHNRAFVEDPSDPMAPPFPGDVGLSFSEILANNCIAFDVKGFDPGVRLLYNAGSDNLPARSSAVVVFGAAGTDDLVLSPSDPGYDDSIGYVASLPAILGNLTASTGAFVDVGWGLKSAFANGGISNAEVASVFNTPLSGTVVSSNSLVPSASWFKSGRAYFSGSSFAVLQPCFDSFTDLFENDGFDQQNALAGSTFADGQDYLRGDPPPTPLPPGADRAVDGLDNDGNGLVDDFPERDTSPPINFAMPAIQATIRLEDKQAGVIQQIAVTQSLVNP